MKSAKALFLTVLLIGTASARPNSDWDRYELLPPVRTLRADRIEYSYNSGKLSEVYRTTYAKLTFTKTGLLKESGSYATPADRTYSVADTPTAEPIDFPMGTRSYRYDSRARLLKVTLREFGKVLEFTTYSYGPGRQMVLASHHDAKGAVIWSEEFSYDTRGNLVEYIHRDAVGTVLGKSSYRYDRRGNHTERVIYNVGGDNEGGTFRILSKYDARGHMIEEKEIGKNEILFSRTSYRCERRGNPISARVYDKDGTLLIREMSFYKFDIAGNWIEKRTMEWRRLIREGQLTFTGVTKIKRRISYY